MARLLPAPGLYLDVKLWSGKGGFEITMGIGILTGLYCAGSLPVAAPPGITPEPWFMVMVVYGRIIQGFVIGFAEGISLHPVIRGAGLGAILEYPALHCSPVCPQLFWCGDALHLRYHLWSTC